jgi:hypothetical protein
MVAVPSLAKPWVAVIVSPVVEGKLTPLLPRKARAYAKACLVLKLGPEPPFGWAMSGSYPYVDFTPATIGRRG